MELYEMSVADLGVMLQNRWINAVEVAGSFASHIERLDPILHTFSSIETKDVLGAAALVDSKRAVEAKLGQLAGIPIGVSDTICVKGRHTTAGSRMLENHIPVYHAEIVNQLVGQDAVLAGMLKVDEFCAQDAGMGEASQTVANPWDTSQPVIGAQKGAAAAVAACMLPGAVVAGQAAGIGQSAAVCGVPGLLLTPHTVSHSGIVTSASSLQTIGMYARTIGDLELLYQLLAKRTEPLNSTDENTNTAPDSIEGLRVGMPAEWFTEEQNEETQILVLQAAANLKKMGASIVELSISSFAAGYSAYTAIEAAEFCSNLARYDGVKFGFSVPGEDLEDLYQKTRGEGFGLDVLEKIVLGNYLLAQEDGNNYLIRGQTVRQKLCREFTLGFKQCDCLLAPVLPETTAEYLALSQEQRKTFKMERFLAPLGLAGLPGVIIPCGLSQGSMPVGMQLIGPAGSEMLLLKAAKWYEDAVGGFAVKELRL